jgi:ankyrin repeat protein
MLRERREIASARPLPPPSPLFAAIASGDAQAVGQRLAEGADPNGPDATGRTPLIAAAQAGHEAVVRRLLAAGADRTLRDRDGLSAADHAERRGHTGLLPLLR